MIGPIAVLTTCQTESEARSIARTLVEARLAACVNIVTGVSSVYRWKDAVEEAGEVLLLIKTSRGLLGQVRETVERMHSYELPEIVALEIADGSERYLEWLASALATDEAAPR